MAERNLNNSWNPLSYSQNLCVNTIVSNNPSITSVATNQSNDTFVDNTNGETVLVDPFSSLDLQKCGNNGINQLVNDLITINNKSEIPLDCFHTFNKSHSINPFLSDNITAKSVSNAFDCGDFGIESSNKANVSTFMTTSLNGVNGFNGLNANQSAYNQNSFQHLMASQSYAENKSFGQQIRPSNHFPSQMNSRVSDSLTNSTVNPFMSSMNDSPNILPNPTTNPLANPMVNQMSTTLSSCPPNSNETVSSLMAAKPFALPYNQKQTFQKLTALEAPPQEMIQMGSRQLRSIRARNSSQSSVEPINKINYYLEKSYEQFKHLEKERKKIECELIQAFVGHKISSANNIPIQKLPQNASKVDRIITDMSREHAKVITIVAKMEQLKGREFNELIHNSIHKWYEIIRDLQMKRKIENQRNATNMASAVTSSEEQLISQFYEIMRQLLSSIRAVRTCLWCALVITLYDQN